MHYKTQSIITILALVAIIVLVGVSIGQLEDSITGAAVTPICDCAEDVDCDDSNPNTQDICMNKDDCQNSYCINK